eukprot:1159439-Pelagomonas_calceolata.AAC.3
MGNIAHVSPQNAQQTDARQSSPAAFGALALSAPAKLMASPVPEVLVSAWLPLLLLRFPFDNLLLKLLAAASLLNALPPRLQGYKGRSQLAQIKQMIEQMTQTYSGLHPLPSNMRTIHQTIPNAANTCGVRQCRSGAHARIHQEAPEPHHGQLCTSELEAAEPHWPVVHMSQSQSLLNHTGLTAFFPTHPFLTHTLAPLCVEQAVPPSRRTTPCLAGYRGHPAGGGHPLPAAPLVAVPSPDQTECFGTGSLRLHPLHSLAGCDHHPASKHPYRQQQPWGCPCHSCWCGPVRVRHLAVVPAASLQSGGPLSPDCWPCFAWCEGDGSGGAGAWRGGGWPKHPCLACQARVTQASPQSLQGCWWRLPNGAAPLALQPRSAL